MEDDVKRCGRCGDMMPLAEFNRNRTTRDGLQASCSTCMRVPGGALPLEP